MSHLRWTEADTQRAREMLAADASQKEFWDALKRTKEAAWSRVKYVDDPEYRKRCLTKVYRSKPEYVSRARQKPSMPETFNPLPTLYGRSEPSPAVPASKFEEAQRRLTAPRSLTAWLCGDPCFSDSALGKKLAGVTP